MLKQLLIPIIFGVTLFYAIGVATNRPLWNDEIWTQNRAIHQKSYVQLIRGEFGEIEGNKAPLFYVVQKAWNQVICYHLPEDLWSYKQTWREKILVRLPWLVIMSLFLTYMFNFFCGRFNIWLGLFAVGLAVTCPVIVWHWTEARPYTLWICLTGWQFILLIKILESTDNMGWVKLILVNILLSFTCILSVFQILTICIVASIKRPRWLWYLWALALPMVFCYFYKQSGTLTDTIFLDTPAMIMMKASSPLAIIILLGWFWYRKQTAFFASIGLLWILSAVFLTYLYVNSHHVFAYIISRHVMDISIVEIIGAVYLVGLWVENKY